MKKVVDQIEAVTNVPVKEITKTSNKILLNKEMLPSRGRYYENDITVRKLNAKEIKDLSRITPTTANSVFNAILADCIEGIDYKDILLNDKIWFIYYLRSITYNDMPYKVKVKCPECGRETYEIYTLDKLYVTYADTPLPDTITLPNGDVIEPCWPTISTEIQINRLKNNPNIIEVIDEDFMTICAHIKTLNGKELTLFDAYQYFTGEDSRGSGYDFASFCQSLKPAIFGARPLFVTDCTCGEDVYTEVTLTPSFFLPTF